LENPQCEGSVKYVALGDSLSAGVGALDIKETFVYLYAQNLLRTYEKVNILNLAWPGDSTSEVIQNQLPAAIKEDPDYVTLMIGTNDVHNKRIISDFREKYKFILNELLTKTDAKIVVINIAYLGSSKLVLPPFSWLLNFRTKQFNDIIAGLANSDRIRLVDLYSATYWISEQNPKYYSSDLFHPSESGYEIWGQVINAH
jgi:lysophospholipase L1-like esterase